MRFQNRDKMVAGANYRELAYSHNHRASQTVIVSQAPGWSLMDHQVENFFDPGLTTFAFSQYARSVETGA